MIKNCASSWSFTKNQWETSMETGKEVYLFGEEDPADGDKETSRLSSKQHDGVPYPKGQ